MYKQARKVQYFLFSQYFSDGLRITFGILLPSLLFAHYNEFNIGLTISLGALCVSIADGPGPVIHKRNGMLISCLSIFLVALITGSLNSNMYLMGIQIFICCFFFSMFTVYGNRASAIGTSSLLIMILLIDQPLEPHQLLRYCLLILAGSVWYMILSLTFFQIRPYRQAQQALGECIMAVSRFLKIKGEFYDPQTDIDHNYHKLITQQIVVSENQDAVRELLFKSRLMVKESTHAGRLLILTFVDVVDMFEQIMATHYDYKSVRDRFGNTGILTEISAIIKHISEEINHVGFAIQSNTGYRKTIDFNNELEKLKTHIDELIGNDTNTLVLKKILINIRNVTKRINNIHVYLNSKDSQSIALTNNNLEYNRFVSVQDYSWEILRNNLTLKSASFKHALRVALVCLAGFIIANVISYGHHSYWILLTIIVILKPGFSLTKERNYQRLIGTVAGGLIGALVIIFIKDSTVQFFFLLVFMVCAYSFQRVNYVISVLFMTPYVIIIFKFLGVGQLNVVEERIIDTLIGSVIAFAASYIIFPTWESEHLKKNMADVLQTNINYLQKIAESLTGKSISITEYKLARKQVYVSSANLSAAFQRMTSEPKSKQQHASEVHKFVVLNHIISSYSATIASGLVHKQHTSSTENLRLLKRAIFVLFEALKKLDPTAENIPVNPSIEISEKEGSFPSESNDDVNLLREQLGFVHKVSADIAKATELIVT